LQRIKMPNAPYHDTMPQHDANQYALLIYCGMLPHISLKQQLTLL